MAKKKVMKEGELPDIMDMMASIDDKTEVLAESQNAVIDDWISTGNYILNACISGSILKGIPSGKIICYYGQSGSGKSFLSCAACAQAIKKGYTVLYLDSEGSITKEFIDRICGHDASKHVLIRSVDTVTEVTQILTNLLNKLGDEKKEYGKCHKMFIVLDSLGNLSDDSEIENAEKGENKANLQKNKLLKNLYRIITPRLAFTQTPFITISHSYASMSMFSPGNIVVGGSSVLYNSSVMLELFPSKLMDKENDAAASKAKGSESNVKNGITVTAKCTKNRFARPKKVQISIPFYKALNPYLGLEQYMTWENSGVCRGTMITEKEYEKLGGESDNVHSWDFNGQKLYCQAKDTARGIVVKHLGKQVSFVDFFKPDVFTDELLKKLDEEVIRPEFELPSQDSFEDIKEFEDTIDVGGEVDEDEATEEKTE